jgi:hypothetical protein
MPGTNAAPPPKLTSSKGLLDPPEFVAARDRHYKEESRWITICNANVELRPARA